MPGRDAVKDQATRLRAGKGATWLMVWWVGMAPRHTPWLLHGAKPMAGTCGWSEKDGSAMLDSTRSSQAVQEVRWGMSRRPSCSVFSKVPAQNGALRRWVSGLLTCGACSGGNTGIEAGCTRTVTRQGGAVPPLPGGMGMLLGRRKEASRGATGAHTTPLGCGSNGLGRYTRRIGVHGRSAVSPP